MEDKHTRKPSYVSNNGSAQYERIDADDDSSTTIDNQGCWARSVSKAFPGGYCKEFKDTMRIAWALIITQMCQIYFQPVATIFGGHLGKVELDAIALSNTLINVFGNSIVIGFATAFDTVFSQTFGRGNYKMVGVYFQKGMILTVLCLLPCYALHLNIEPILLGLGQDPEVSRLVGDYLLYFMPGMFCLFMWTSIRKFTQCQNDVTPHIIFILIAHGIHALLQYLFLYQFGFGIIGSAFAQGITFFFLMVVTLIYTVKSATFANSWGGFDKRCLHGWGELGRLGVYGMLMLCMEWWAFEISVIVAGTIGTTELAAQSVTFNVNSFCFAAPSGLAIATSIRIGQLLGASNPLRAKTAARVGMTITFVNACVWLIVFATARYELPKIFTNVPEVIDLVAELLPFVAVFTLGDAITTIGRGVLRGIGKQLWGTVIIFIAYYLIAVPLALCLTFLTPLSVKGLWLGFLVAIYISAITYFTLTNFKINWVKHGEEAQLRAIGKASGHVDLSEEVNEETKLLNVENVYEEMGQKISKGLILKRVFTCLVFVLILLAGVIARLTTSGLYRQESPLGDDVWTNDNMTSSYNVTTSSYNITSSYNTTTSSYNTTTSSYNTTTSLFLNETFTLLNNG